MERIEAARSLLNYDKETGIFTWKPRIGVVSGKELGCDNGNGYKRITLLCVQIYAHHLAWMYEYGDVPKNQIDHINGDKSDNRISNLRDVVPSVNAQNKTKAQKNSKSGVQGVSWNKNAKKWQVHISINKEKKYLGIYDSIDEAKSIYENNKKELRA